MQMVETPILNMRGEKVALGPLRAELVPVYHRWMNSFRVVATAASEVMPYSLEKAGEFYREGSRDRENMEFTIYIPVDADTRSARTWRPIGTAGLHHIHYVNRSADFGILIGEQDCWSKGYGSETARLLLDYGFNVVALHNIGLSCFVSNVAGIKAYERAGFRRIGVMHGCRWLEDHLEDVLLMDCLASEFGESSVLGQLSRSERP